MDTRADFNNAARCLRNVQGFREGNSLEDTDAHFVVLKTNTRPVGERNLGGSGLNKQTIWVRNDVLEEWI